MTKEVHFAPSRVRHITVDSHGNIYTVDTMFDRFANETQDPALATACIIDLGEILHPTSTDDVPIYTVH